MSRPSVAGHFRIEDRGTWCCLLLPLVVCLHNQLDFLPIILLAVTSLLCGVSWEITGITCTNVSLLVSLVSMVAAISGLSLPCIVCLVPCLFLYCLLVSKVPGWFPGSFTFGEMSLVCQGYVFFLYKVLTHSVIETRLAPVTLDTIVGAVFAGTSLVVLCLYEFRHPSIYRLVPYMAGLLLTGFLLNMQAVNLVAELMEIQSTLQEVILSYTSAFLLVWWMLCTLGCILIVCYYGNQRSFNHVTEIPKSGAKILYAEGEKTNCMGTLDMELPNMQLSKPSSKTDQIKSPEHNLSKSCDQSSQSHDRSSQSCDSGCDHTVVTRRAPVHVRKYFHGAMLCVYVPGLMLKPDLLYLATTGAAAIMVVLEAVRMLNIPPLGELLDVYLKVFLDEQDKGHLILTPIYLLIGCSLPLWIANRNADSPCSVLLYAGLVSVGIGDSAASVIGRKFGRHKWPHSKKSIEGTVAAVVSQLLALHLLSWAGVPGASVTMATVILVVLISCLEAFTNQIDNLVMPVFAFTLFTVYQCYTLNTLDLRGWSNPLTTL